MGPKPPLFSHSAATIAPFTIVLPTERLKHAATKVLPDVTSKRVVFLLITRRAFAGGAFVTRRQIRSTKRNDTGEQFDRFR